MNLLVRELTALDFSYVDLYNRVMKDNDYDHDNIGNIVKQNIKYYLKIELKQKRYTSTAIIDLCSFGRMSVHNVLCDFDQLAFEISLIMRRLFRQYVDGNLVLNEKLDKPDLFY